MSSIERGGLPAPKQESKSQPEESTPESTVKPQEQFPELANSAIQDRAKEEGGTRINVECERFLENMSQTEVDQSVFDEDIKTGIKHTVHKQPLHVAFLCGATEMELGHWRVFHHNGNDAPMSIGDLRNRMFALSKDITDQNKKESFQAAYSKKESELREEVDTAWLSKKDLIYQSVDATLSLETLSPLLRGYEEYLEILETALATYKSEQKILSETEDTDSASREKRYDVFRELYPSVIALVERKITETRAMYDAMKTETKEPRLKQKKMEKKKSVF